ncbi:ThuA-like domain-containing protein [Lasiosphaeris hirsuta]|uniref:ThuA-like domain-containing protein n=1 Tax=Lasiosphaeris hirsuta TaxID=260670 RepID=A0AA40DWK0_9PEZI|nr:ThuA-like domain-containing protein [Lasiosphaeris hirsuta]
MPPLHILIFSATAGYRHACIPAAITALQQLSHTSPAPFTTHATEDPTIFTPLTLAPFAVIVLLHVSGDFLTSPTQLAALQTHVRNGGGVVAIHGASTGLPSSAWYARLTGGAFANHPVPQLGRVRIVDAAHPIVAASLGRGGGMVRTKEGDKEGESQWEWVWTDEWYNFRADPDVARGDLHVLLSVDEGSYEGGEHGRDHPIAWCQEFEGGRSFYTALGHFDEAYDDEGFMAQILGGILWTARVTG